MEFIKFFLKRWEFYKVEIRGKLRESFVRFLGILYGLFIINFGKNV